MRGLYVRESCYLRTSDWAQRWLICSKYYTVRVRGCGYVDGCRPSWTCDKAPGKPSDA